MTAGSGQAREMCGNWSLARMPAGQHLRDEERTSLHSSEPRVSGAGWRQPRAGIHAGKDFIPGLPAGCQDHIDRIDLKA